MAGDIILRVEDLEKRFGGIVALDKVGLEIERGKVTLLIGPNGSGKTTLVNVISGFYKPDGGRVLFKGRDITGMSPHEISKLGLVRTFQIPKPFANLTVLENVLTAADSPGGERVSSWPG
ncbi:ATP-binding cassette domain-containing protein [Aeropyrum camini]|uniref:ATP-binding cassette domain-containing protein n=1 Tax=Aeropyrum camini TaxID=229980 RepID=UPI00210EC737|nr:ATP-binding cassette domain-containing protein [Aeropyrum camini]